MLMSTPDRLIGSRELCDMLGRSSASLWRDHAAGRLPQSLTVGRRSTRWRLSEIESWIAAGCPAREVFEAGRAAAKRGAGA